MKNSTTKTSKYLFVSRGPGEAGQAAALAKYCAGKGAKVLFCFAKDINRFFLPGEKNIQTFLTPTATDFLKLAAEEKPQAVLFFNSKMWTSQLKERPSELTEIKCYGVDSNWLFNNRIYPKYPFLDWLDRYFVLFPKKIFDLGFTEKSGGFAPAENKEKIIAVGFMPSYEKPNKKAAAKKEKTIFAYFSGYGAGHRAWALENLIKAVDLLVKKRKKINKFVSSLRSEIKVLYVGPTKEIINFEKLKRNWLLTKDGFNATEYFLTLANSDLVFQHQGMVTLAQAISANVPVIANVSLLKDEALPKIHFWEVKPFDKANACLMLAKNDSPLKIAKSIESLLYNKPAIAKMRKAQKNLWQKGEPTIYNYLCAN